MGSKSAQGGGKGKRKNDGPAEKRYTNELRWIRNKERAIAKDKRLKAKVKTSPKKAAVKTKRAAKQAAKRGAKNV